MEDLTYDYTFMMADTVGEHGATEAELEALRPTLEKIHQDFLYQKDNDQLGFTRLPYESATVQAVQKLADEVRRDFSALVVLGIGGSDLGARALHAALNHKYYNELPGQTHKLYFAGANTDAKELADLVDILDWETTAINVISKSGDTVETMSAFVYLRQKLVEAVGLEAAAEHIIVSTDAEKGSLRSIVEREGYRSLVVPADVGGRFSVLSSVGLFPAAYVGINIQALLDGAAEMDERVTAAPVMQNPAMVYAALQYLANTKRQQPLSVLMPYADGLQGVAMWYRQLWAESLGKEVDKSGKKVYVGPTPIASVGATDQHSQVQLYMEGPFDKVITLVRVEESSRSVLLTDGFDQLPEIDYLKGVELNDILLAEAQSTAMALAHNGRANGSIALPQLNEQTLGQLLYFFELATAYSGDLYAIDAYNQPGVELGKQLMYAQMGRKGYGDKLKDFEHLMMPKKKYEV